LPPFENNDTDEIEVVARSVLGVARAPDTMKNNSAKLQTSLTGYLLKQYLRNYALLKVVVILLNKFLA
jgi:hypothetical protein